MRPIGDRMQSRKFLLAIVVLLLAFVLYALGRIGWSEFTWMAAPVVLGYLGAEALTDTRR